MRCAWNEFVGILPMHMRQEVDKRGRDTLLELRLRLGQRVQLITLDGCVLLGSVATEGDILFVVNAASRYSPWCAETVRDGYITAQGGHRIGISGDCVSAAGSMTGIRRPTSLCVRVARDITNIAPPIHQIKGSVLILGPPGSGKTTLLRDLIRSISNCCQGSVAVVDERREIFPDKGDFNSGLCTDILSGCGKSQGICAALRTMGPTWIAVDEITEKKDCDALLQAVRCGVRLLATAHAFDKNDLFERTIYTNLIDSGSFNTILILRQDKTWYLERLKG